MDNEEKILGMLGQIVDRLDNMDSRLDNMDSRLDNMDSRLDRLETAQAEMQASQAEMQKTLAEHSDLLKILDERSLKSAVLLETDVARDIHLVYEGHAITQQQLKKLASAERVEAVERDMFVVKETVRTLCIDVNDLKKAQ